jgi:hypothetical protein
LITTLPIFSTMETNKTDTCSTCKKSGEIENNYGLNISEEHKTFLWLWAKTGTSHLKQNMKYFGFNFYMFDGGKRSFLSKGITQQHTCQLFEGHHDYKMLATARNPYSRYVSFYIMAKKDEATIENFDDFLETQIFHHTNFDCVTFHDRIPDYFVRVENLFEDYSKIPFVVKSDYYKSGLLEEFCNKKINKSKFEVDWKDYYNQSMADLVFYNTQNYFEILGYDKNSWKK